MSKGVKRPLHEGVELGQMFLTAIQSWEFERSILCGSIRREMKEVGDVDIVIVVADEKQRVVLNARLLMIFGELKTKKGRARRHGEFEGTQINVIDVLPEQAGAALLHATGSAEFNIVLRRKAKSLGFKLNQYGLFTVNEDGSEGDPACDAFTEEAVFAKLGEKYVDPRDRTIEMNIFKDKNYLKKGQPHEASAKVTPSSTSS